MADTRRPAPTIETPDVVEQIDSLLRRDLDVVDVADERIVIDLADTADDGLAIIAVEAEPDEQPVLDVDLTDPAVLDSLEQLVELFDDPQLHHLLSLVRRQS